MSHDPETRLLLECLSTKEDGETACRFHGISLREIDWAYLLRFSQDNGLTPLLYHSFKKAGVTEHISPEVKKVFKKTYYSMGFHNSLYYEELRNLLHLFGKAGIKTIILKGAAITDAVFKNIALRQMSDIDLLVMRQHLEMSAEVLSDAGYIPDEHRHTKEWYRMHHHHLVPYIHPDKGFVVEIHHHIIDPENSFGINTRLLWERAQSVRIGDVTTLALSSEDLLIHLCFHVAYFGGFFGGLKNVIDIAQILRHHGLLLDWDRIISDASEHHYTDFIYYPLYLTKRLFDANIERNVLDALKQSSKLSAMEISLLNLMTTNILLKEEASSLLPKGYLALLCKELLHDAPSLLKMRSLIKRLLHPPHSKEESSGGSLMSDGASTFRVQRVAGIFNRTFRHLAGVMLHKNGTRVIFLGLLVEHLMRVNI